MIYTKSIEVDIAHQYLNDVIRLHEGDAAGAQLQITLFDNGEAFNVEAFTVKYDAVIAGYLAENGASATVSNNVITVPITANMCAKSGTLEIDVKIIEGSGSNAKTFFLQKFEAQVQRRVVNEDVIIDVSGTTIGAKITALEEKFPIGTDDIDAGAVTKKKLGSDALEDVVPKTRTVAGVDLQDDITAEELRGALSAMKREDILVSSLNTAVENGVLYYVYTESNDERQYQHMVWCVSDESKRTQFMLTALSTAQAQANRFMYRQQEYDAENDSWGSWSSFSPVVPVPDAYTKAEVDELFRNHDPLYIRCDMAVAGAVSGTSFSLTVSNATAAFSDIVSAYAQGRDVVIIATAVVSQIVLEIIVPLLGVAKSGSTIINTSFRVSIPNDVMSVLYSQWSSYDCFLSMSCNQSNGYTASIVCNSAALAEQIGDVEALLSQV